MSDCMEKIYCCDGGMNNGLSEAALLNSMNNGFGGNNGMWFLLLLLLGGRGWNGYGNGFGNGVGTEFSLLQDQAQQNQNTNLLREAMRDNFSATQQLAQNLNCDFNTLQQCCCDLKQAIATVGGQVGFSAERVINAVNMGDCNVIQAIKDCCCTTQKAILEQGYQNQLAICNQTGELRNGQRDLGVAIAQGFAQVGYQQAADKCEIIRAGQDNTQRIIDTMNNHWKDEQAREIQDLKAALSQKEQTDILTQRIFRANGWNWNNCGCGCGNGVGY